MKSFYILALVFGFLSGCTPWADSTTECETFLKSFETNWHYDDDQKIYQFRPKGQTNKSFLNDFFFDKKECLLGRSDKQIKKLLGEPSFVKGQEWRYYLYASCHQKRASCDYVYLEFDDQRQVAQVEMRGGDLSH